MDTDARALLEHAAQLKRHPTNKLARYRPYGHPDTLNDDWLRATFGERVNLEWSHRPWQWEFHEAGIDFSERMLRAANRVGKTECGAAEVAFHATGQYPDWWPGREFDGDVLIWVGSVTNEASRDITQRALLGGIGARLGTGYIPKDAIHGKPKMRQAGIHDVVDGIEIKRAVGGDVYDYSYIGFKSYDQGWRKFQGTAPHIVWLDEEPDENMSNEARIYAECQTRILSSMGSLIVTFTPLLGETELVRHFDMGLSNTYMVEATWDDAPHLDRRRRRELELSYPEHELQARTHGVPMMGSGRVFPVKEDDIKVNPFEIPKHFFQICGIDFGIDHPAAAAWLAIDRDKDIWYVTDVYRRSNQTTAVHASAIKRRGLWIPVAWPHDGMNREKRSGIVLKDSYVREGVNMLPISARYKREIGGGQDVEPIIVEFLERMNTGRLKVFATCSEWFDEFRSYHRKDGKLSQKREDVLKASFYAGMMHNYAAQNIVRTSDGGGWTQPWLR